MKKIQKFKTKRLVLEPMTKESSTENQLCDASWSIRVKATEETIGTIGLKGTAQDAAVEICCEIDETYRNNGYTTEAGKTVIDWVFSQEGIYFIEAETEVENEASKKVLEKLGFTPDGEGEEREKFLLTKPKSSWIAIFLCLGVALGSGIGLSSGNQATGMCLGMCIGIAVGAGLDAKEKATLEKLLAERKNFMSRQNR